MPDPILQLAQATPARRPVLLHRLLMRASRSWKDDGFASRKAARRAYRSAILSDLMDRLSPA